MSELVEAVRSLGVRFEASDSDNWVRFTCEEGRPRYIIRSRLADGYLTWCQTDEHSQMEWYLKPKEAIHRQHSIPPPPLDEKGVPPA